MRVVKRVAKRVAEPDDLAAEVRFVDASDDTRRGSHDRCAARREDIDAVMAASWGARGAELAANVALCAGPDREGEGRSKLQRRLEATAAKQLRLSAQDDVSVLPRCHAKHSFTGIRRNEMPQNRCGVAVDAPRVEEKRGA